MNTIVQYCPYCVDQLCEWGEPAKYAFELITTYYTMYGEAFILDEEVPGDDKFVQVVNFLESKHYVVTTDLNASEIAVVPQACEPINGIWIVCCDNPRHGFLEREGGR